MTTDDDFVLQLIEDSGLVEPQDIANIRDSVEAEGIDDNPEGEVIDRLIRDDKISEDQIIGLLSLEFQMDKVDLSKVSVTEEALEKVDAKMAKRYNVMPIEIDMGALVLAVSDPLDMDSIDSIGHMAKVSIDARLASPSSIKEAIANHYDVGVAGEMSDAYKDIGLEEETGDDDDVDIELPIDEEDASEEEAPIIRYVHTLIRDAIKRRASDIHLEPLERRFRVRLRIDGVMQEIESPPKRLQPSIISRLKLMANISIAEKRKPQDGRIQMKTKQKEIDLRVSCLPTVFGESIVMRILDKEGLNLGLPQLGFFSDDQSTFERLIAMPDGIFLVTGPTGSGKSTTLYSALNYINKPDRKIITVEDPVEYQMTGINQVQVRRDIGMTFSAALRSMLRQAPNIIMIGEIRDRETAEIAVNASLTGHMVFSTLHTNDAPSAVTRLVDIGVKPFLVAASLRGVLAQRLVRRICQSCRKPFTPETKDLLAIGMNEQQISQSTFYKGEGCPKCNGTGFKGRVGIFEMFLVTEEMQSMIYDNKSIIEIRGKAREGGMRSMREDGVRKVTSGITTPEEVLLVTIADNE